MKKIIRIASVIALASASLLYVGCTKDFSADIAKTNQDVAALNQKIETLNSTVQTINSTVENLKTTKADLTVVNALGDRVATAEGNITTLGGKIDGLDAKLTSTKTDLEAAIATAKKEAIDAASTDAAAKLAAAKTELEGLISDVNKRADSLATVTAATEKNVVALRADADTLKLRADDFEARIAALEGRVDALAARITSIVAVPSMNNELLLISADTAKAHSNNPSFVDTAYFTATFKVLPKAAVASIDESKIKLSVKEGLVRASLGADTTFNVSKVIKNEKDGEITVFAGLSEIPDIPYDKVLVDVESEVTKEWLEILGITVPVLIGINVENNVSVYNPQISYYYSLSFADEDEAGEYERASEYQRIHWDYDYYSTWNAKAVEVVDGEFVEFGENSNVLFDTLAFNSEDPDFEQLLSLEKVNVAFDFNGNLISAEEFGELVNGKINVWIDTTFINPSDTLDGFKITNKGTKLYNATKENVGNTQSVAGVLKVGAYTWVSWLEENHTIGAKTVEYTLPAVSEPWTYTSWEKVSRTVSITDCEDVHTAVPADGIKEGAFKITKDTGKGVDIAVTNALRNPEAKDTTYIVAFKKEVEELGPKDTVNFTINWKYTLEARPADATIALADVDTVATDYTNSITVAIVKNIVAKTFAAFDAAYDKTIDTAAVNAAIEGATVVLDSVVFNGKKVSGAGLNTEKTAVVLPALSKAGAYSVILHKKVFGITYTYTYTINIAWKEALKLHPTPYVSARVAVVDADTTDASGVYTLKEMDMAKYLQVFNADTLAKGFNGYNVVFHYELEDSAKFVNGDEAVVINDVDFDTTALAVTNGILGQRKLNWNGYNGREVEITAFLVNSKDTVDTYTFKLQYRKPITSFAAGTQEVKRVAGVDTTVVLDKAMVIKGLYNGEKNLIVDTTGAWINGKNYYSCEIAYDIEKASFKVNGESTIFAPGVDYEFTAATNANAPETATIKFIGDNNNKNIEASIPVVLTYKYDYNHVEAYKDNVVIKVVNE